jgi:hypothetical protein
MAAIVQPRLSAQTRDSLDILEDKIEYLLKFVTIISELVLLLGLAYAGFKLAHKGPTPETLDQIWLVSQVLALDLSAPGLFAMAAQARDLGEEKRARWAIRIAIILIVMSILTMVEGAVTSYLPGIPHAAILYVTLTMMIIRGGAAVGYSVFRRLHKAEKYRSITPAQTVPAQQIDYQEIVRHLQPFIAQPVADVSGLTEQVQQLRATVEALATKNEPTGNTEAQIVDIEDYRNEQQPAQQPRAKVTRKLSTPSATKSAPTAKQKCQQIARRNPGISASELATKAGISRQYASKILAKRA